MTQWMLIVETWATAKRSRHTATRSNPINHDFAGARHYPWRGLPEPRSERYGQDHVVMTHSGGVPAGLLRWGIACMSEWGTTPMARENGAIGDDDADGPDDFIRSQGQQFVVPVAAAENAEEQLTLVPISTLLTGNSPRLSGEDQAHTHMLAEMDKDLPPILVHRQSMRVVDGMHRLRVAISRGADTIAVRFFEGSEEDAFVCAVQANVTHGLPLTRADREAAAVRILTSHPRWSDRRVAAVAGLSAQTIAMLRQRPTDEDGQLDTRVGRDGRVRPLDSSRGREIAGMLIKARPDASLREIAKESGISPETARDVRERVRRGEDLLTTKARKARTKGHRDDGPSSAEPARQLRDRPTRADPIGVLNNLRKDPSLRFSETGRLVLQGLSALTLESENPDTFINAIPWHCRTTVAELARSCVETWKKFSDELDKHISDTG